MAKKKRRRIRRRRGKCQCERTYLVCLNDCNRRVRYTTAKRRRGEEQMQKNSSISLSVESIFVLLKVRYVKQVEQMFRKGEKQRFHFHL